MPMWSLIDRGNPVCDNVGAASTVAIGPHICKILDELLNVMSLIIIQVGMSLTAGYDVGGRTHATVGGWVDGQGVQGR